jgi:hypothetical protein
MELNEPSDREVLASANPGDYGVFSDRHLGTVRSYVASRVRQPDVVFGLVAETFARAGEAGAVRSGTRPSGWLADRDRAQSDHRFRQAWPG